MEFLELIAGAPSSSLQQSSFLLKCPVLNFYSGGSFSFSAGLLGLQHFLVKAGA